MEKLTRATPELILNTTTLLLDTNKLTRLDNIHTYQCLEKVKSEIYFHKTEFYHFTQCFQKIVNTPFKLEDSFSKLGKVFKDCCGYLFISKSVMCWQHLGGRGQRRTTKMRLEDWEKRWYKLFACFHSTQEPDNMAAVFVFWLIDLVSSYPKLPHPPPVWNDMKQVLRLVFCLEIELKIQNSPTQMIWSKFSVLCFTWKLNLKSKTRHPSKDMKQVFCFLVFWLGIGLILSHQPICKSLSFRHRISFF